MSRKRKIAAAAPEAAAQYRREFETRGDDMSDDANNELAGAARKYWSAEGYTPGGVLREVDYAAASKGLDPRLKGIKIVDRSEEHTSELQSLMRISYAVFCLKKKKKTKD